jgi:hypothetical protein
MMDAKTSTLLLGVLLLAAWPPAAADGGDGPAAPDLGCSVVDVTAYDPYVAVRERCLPPPLGEG